MKSESSTNHILFLLSVAIIAMGFYYKNLHEQDKSYISKADTEKTQIINCQIYPIGCSKHQGDFDFKISAEQRLETLKPTTLIFSAGPNNLFEPISIRADMIGMQMGDNIFQFTEVANKNNKSQFHAEIILPFCSVGRNDWTLSIKLKHQKTGIYELVSFQFTL